MIVCRNAVRSASNRAKEYHADGSAIPGVHPARASLQFARAYERYRAYTDKEWSLTYCASNNLMAARGIHEALAHDDCAMSTQRFGVRLGVESFRDVAENARMCMVARSLIALLALALASVVESAPNLSKFQRDQLAIHVRQSYPFQTTGRWTTIRAAAVPLDLGTPTSSMEIEWELDGATRTVERYFEQRPVTALLVAKDGKLVFEKYQYTGTREALFMSNSMAKSFTGVAVALLEADGKIQALDDRTERYLPALKGSRSGATSLKNHLRMGSGIRYEETYRPDDDHSRFTKAIWAFGTIEALKTLTDQDAEPGSIFNYAGHSSATLSSVVQAVAGVNQASFLESTLWQKIGSEHSAHWREDSGGATLGYCCLLARARDYMRLGVVLAHDGKRPDTAEQVIPQTLMRRITRVDFLDPPFRPPRSGLLGYESQFWISGRTAEAFMLVGRYGQIMVVYPRSRLVILHLAVNESTTIADTSTLSELQALLGAIWRRYR